MRPTNDDAVKAAMDRLATPDYSQPEMTAAADILARALPGTSKTWRDSMEYSVPQMFTQHGPHLSRPAAIRFAFALGVRLGREIE